MNKNDKFYKEVYDESSKALEEFIENISKLIKYSLVPIALFVSVIVVKHQDILGAFVRPYTFFVAFWAGVITIFIFQIFSFKINTMDANFILKYFLKFSLIILLCTVFISGSILAVNKLPNEFKGSNQAIEQKIEK